MSDLAAQLTRTTTISHQRAQDLIDEVTRLGFNAAQVVQMSPDDPVEMLEFVSQIAKREMLADVRPTVDYTCGWGTCSIWTEGGKVAGGVGDPLCGCDNLPGWNSPYPAGTPKPQAPVKARGRHGSRVQRSTARRVEWRRMVAEYGTEVCR